jgi:hypothetical protein
MSHDQCCCSLPRATAATTGKSFPGLVSHSSYLRLPLLRQECCRNCNYVRHELVLVQETALATQDFSEILLPDGRRRCAGPKYTSWGVYHVCFQICIIILIFFFSFRCRSWVPFYCVCSVNGLVFSTLYNISSISPHPGCPKPSFIDFVLHLTHSWLGFAFSTFGSYNWIASWYF